jgi:lipid-A-disaccharide synthase
MVTSGTATLETALYHVPQVVCYKGSTISYAIAKRLIKVDYIALVNLIMNRPVVKELIQHQLTAANIETELKKIVDNKEQYRSNMLKAYKELEEKLGGGGASDKVAELMLNRDEK